MHYECIADIENNLYQEPVKGFSSFIQWPTIKFDIMLNVLFFFQNPKPVMQIQQDMKTITAGVLCL